MKIKAWFLLASMGAMVAACAGSKNAEPTGDNSAIFAVRTLEDANGNGDGQTQVALLQGNFQTPEDAKAAAANAQWTNIDQFQSDDELAFAPADQVSTTRMNDRGDNWGQNNRNRNRGGNNDWNRGNRGDNRGGNWNNNNRQRWNHNSRNHNWNRWRPFVYSTRYTVRWTNWQRPVRPFYGYSTCGYQYIWYGGQCVFPVTRRYSYGWQHFYGYSVSFRINGVSRPCRVRFYR